jgi:hypothetical protein
MCVSKEFKSFSVVSAHDCVIWALHQICRSSPEHAHSLLFGRVVLTSTALAQPQHVARQQVH